MAASPCDDGLDGLDDAPRSGRPVVHGPTERLVLMAKVRRSTRTSPPSGATPSWLRPWAKPASASQIGRMLAADDVKSHRVEGWLTRRGTSQSSGGEPPMSAVSTCPHVKARSGLVHRIERGPARRTMTVTERAES
jgi:hypothetical protein